jgi:hypothetical protein
VPIYWPHSKSDSVEEPSRIPDDLSWFFNVIWAVQPSLQKYFGFHTPQITSRTLAIPSHTEGRFAIVTDVGTGCGGRGSVLRAMGSQGGSKDL